MVKSRYKTLSLWVAAIISPSLLFQPAYRALVWVVEQYLDESSQMAGQSGTSYLANDGDHLISWLLLAFVPGIILIIIIFLKRLNDLRGIWHGMLLLVFLATNCFLFSLFVMWVYGY